MKKIIILIYILFSSLIAGDGSASNTFESEADQVIINDIPLSYNISIQGSNSRFIYDLLDARVIIKNKDSNKHYLEYKFLWYDVSGFGISKGSSKWKRIVVDAKDTIVVKSLAITSKIDSFKFYVRGIEN